MAEALLREERRGQYVTRQVSLVLQLIDVSNKEAASHGASGSRSASGVEAGQPLQPVSSGSSCNSPMNSQFQQQQSSQSGGDGYLSLASSTPSRDQYASDDEGGGVPGAHTGGTSAIAVNTSSQMEAMAGFKSNGAGPHAPTIFGGKCAASLACLVVF